MNHFRAFVAQACRQSEEREFELALETRARQNNDYATPAQTKKVKRGVIGHIDQTSPEVPHRAR
jgi:hypothetical protein